MDNNKLLQLLCENARYTNAELASRCNCTQEEIVAQMQELENTGIIGGYTVILNDEAIADKPVKALIEVKVAPRRDGGFDQVAQRIAKFPEVSDVALISGSFDLLLTVQGRTLQEVAGFVSSKLATIDGVISTSTGFLLKKYKEAGHLMQQGEEYERLKVCF